MPLCLRLHVVGGRLVPVLVSRLTNYIIKLISIAVVTGLVKTSPRIVVSLTPGSIAAPVTVRMSGTMKKVPSLATTIIVIIKLFKTVYKFGLLRMKHMTDPVTRKLSVKATDRTINASHTVRIDNGCNTCTDLKLALGKVLATLLSPAVLRVLKLCWSFTFMQGRLGSQLVYCFLRVWMFIQGRGRAPV